MVDDNTTHAYDPNKNRRINEVVERCRQQSVAGEPVDADTVIAEHPDLMPELGDRLRDLVDQIMNADSATVSIACNATPDGPFKIPSTVGDVKIERELGRGGMGVVYVGWDAVLHRKVAVKFLLHVAADHNSPAFERFFGGARAEADVRHPNVVAVYAAGHVQDVPYIVMDYIEGPTLRQLMQQTAPLPQPAVFKIMWDVADAVAALHRQDIIHRDLKPANILFDEGGQLYVTDFGLASLRRRSATAPAMVGTPPYMAPECFDGKSSPQSDVYALGIMFFELLTGRRPFDGALLTLRRQHDTVPIPVGDLPDSVSQPLIEVIQRAAHKQDMFRYKTAEHFQRALGEIFTGDALRPEGETELRKLVLRLRGSPHADKAAEQVADSTSTYFERLSEIAGEKRESRDTPKRIPADQPPVGPPGMRLACECGYDLHGLLSERCPECGREIDWECIAQPRTPWVHRREIGRIRAFLRTKRFVVWRTEQFLDEFNRPLDAGDARTFRQVVVGFVFLAISVVAGLWYVANFGIEQLSSIEKAVNASILMISLLLFLLSAAFAPLYFLQDRNCPPETRQRIWALCDYAAAPLLYSVPSGAILATLITANRLWWPNSSKLNVLLVSAGGLVCLCLVTKWLSVLIRIARRHLQFSTGKLVGVTCGLIASWLMLAILLLAGIPALALYIALIYFSLN